LRFILVLLAALAGAGPAAASEPVSPERLYVLAINGGGDREDNFASHLSHLRQLAGLLERAKVPHDHVTVLSSDGSNPASDLAVAEPEPEGTWLLEGTSLGRLLRHSTEFENSTLTGYDLRPATRTELRLALASLRARLKAGDTLFLFVTDHGTVDMRDPLGNRITLWGARESVSVRELGGMLGRLPDGVRVVTLMSQCFSGGFAYLYDARARAGAPSGAVCGYFASTSDRPAYGCYPETRGAESVGHAFEFLQALGESGRFVAAQERVLFSDQSPDVPLRSSDAFLDEILLQAARDKRVDDNQFVDDLLAKAWKEDDTTRERNRIDRLTAEFGLPALRDRTMAEITQRSDELANLLDRLDGYSKTWSPALADLNQAHLDGFLAAHPDYAARLALPKVRKLGAKDRRALAADLLQMLVAWVESDAKQLPRLERMIDAMASIDEVTYRTEVRLAVLLRVRTILLDVAGRFYARTQPEQAEALAALEACEDLRLPLSGSSAKPAARTPLTAQDVDQKAARRFVPAWLGFHFMPVAPAIRKRLSLPDGAVRVVSVAGKSPAATAGLLRGDILVGAAGEPFTRDNPVRPNVVTAPLNGEWSLDLQRGKERLSLRLRPQAAPEKPSSASRR
jgi:hypothetical protein